MDSGLSTSYCFRPEATDILPVGSSHAETICLMSRDSKYTINFKSLETTFDTHIGDGCSVHACVCHIMEHEISAYYDITHGHGLAILTPHWLSYILDEKTLRQSPFIFSTMYSQMNGEDSNNEILRFSQTFHRQGLFFLQYHDIRYAP